MQRVVANCKEWLRTTSGCLHGRPFKLHAHPSFVVALIYYLTFAVIKSISHKCQLGSKFEIKFRSQIFAKKLENKRKNIINFFLIFNFLVVTFFPDFLLALFDLHDLFGPTMQRFSLRS